LIRDIVAKVGEGYPWRNNRIQTSRSLNQCCFQALDLESILPARTRKIFLQQYPRRSGRFRLQFTFPACAASVRSIPASQPRQSASRHREARPRRTTTFEEVQHGLDETNTLYEARRCLSCGNASNATIVTAPVRQSGDQVPARQGLPVQLRLLQSCGVSAQACPCGAIAMVPEAT